MHPSDQLVDNVKSLLKPYFKRPSNEWWWEDPLVKIVQICFHVPNDPLGNPTLAVTSGTYRGTVQGTGSPQWNDVIQRAGQRLRSKENPHPYDYRAGNYQNDSALTAVSRLAARFLTEEATRINLEIPNDEAT